MEDAEKKEIAPEPKEGELIKEEEKKTSDKILIWSIAIIIALTLILVGSRYITQKKEVPLTIDEMHQLNIKGKLPPEQGYLYNDAYSFVYIDGMWYSQVQSGNVLVNVPLRYGPKDVESISLNGWLNEDFIKSESIFITFDPLSSDLTYTALAVGELDQSLISAFGNKIIAACDKNETEFGDPIAACAGRPIKTCENSGDAIIYIIESEEPELNLKGNCIEIKGRGIELLRHADRLLLEFYGVMKRN